MLNKARIGARGKFKLWVLAECGTKYLSKLPFIKRQRYDVLALFGLRRISGLSAFRASPQKMPHKDASCLQKHIVVANIALFNLKQKFLRQNVEKMNERNEH